jgi:hypothetical protein
MAQGERIFRYYAVPSTHLARGGRKSEVVRSSNAWAAAITRHRRTAHGGQRDGSCAACAELEQKHAAAIAQEEEC